MRGLPAALLALALAAPPPAFAQNRAAFEAELDGLRTALGIPSMSAAVVEGDTIVWVRHFGIEAGPGEAVRYPIASLTEPLAATLALRLVERGRLRLDEPVPDAGPGVLVRHLLTQTAAGTPGARFVYSSALYAKLQAPIERAARASFATALEAEVLRPAGMRHTVTGARTTPSAGVQSTVEDLARFAIALNGGRLLKGASLAAMFRAPRDEGGHPFPYALGWFVQAVGGEQVRWQYGQDADSSALLLMLPRRRLSFVLLARSDRLSAPFWLQFGDLRWSPAAVAFFDRWAEPARGPRVGAAHDARRAGGVRHGPARERRLAGEAGGGARPAARQRRGPGDARRLRPLGRRGAPRRPGAASRGGCSRPIPGSRACSWIWPCWRSRTATPTPRRIC